MGVEFYPEPKKLGTQLKYASQRGFRLALVVGESEFAASECQIKVLASGEKIVVSTAEDSPALMAEIHRQLRATPPG